MILTRLGFDARRRQVEFGGLRLAARCDQDLLDHESALLALDVGEHTLPQPFFCQPLDLHLTKILAPFSSKAS